MELSEVVGKNAKAIRERSQRTMSDVANRAAALGTRWNSGSIAKIEAGEPRVTVSSLIVLAAALDCRTRDLIATDQTIELTSTLRVSAEVLDAALASRETILGPHAELQEMYHEVSELDRKLAAEFGRDRLEFVYLSRLMWNGNTFAQERDSRAGPSANAQKRGQITRQMKAELKQAIANADRDDDCGPKLVGSGIVAVDDKPLPGMRKRPTDAQNSHHETQASNGNS